jgi:hypothetical protein
MEMDVVTLLALRRKSLIWLLPLHLVGILGILRRRSLLLSGCEPGFAVSGIQLLSQPIRCLLHAFLWWNGWNQWIVVDGQQERHIWGA